MSKAGWVEGKGGCGSCGEVGAGSLKKCGGCHRVAYCSAACQKRDWARHRGRCSPISITELEDRGRGLVATKDLNMGDLIVKDRAVICVGADLDSWEAGPEIQKQVDKLPADDRLRFYELTKMQRLLDLCGTLRAAAGGNSDQLRKAEQAEQHALVSAIFYNNDISAADESKCLFLTLALLNHSCAPNSSWARAGENVKELELRAIRDIRRGEEITVNYISVEGRYSDKDTRQQKLAEGWGFKCCCSLCTSGAEEEIKSRIRALQLGMVAACEASPARVDWAALARAQEKVVAAVGGLACAPLLLPRECQSLANLAQLARRPHLLTQALELWLEVLHRRKIKQAIKQFEQIQQSFKDWRKNLEKGLQPHDREIENFLWLM